MLVDGLEIWDFANIEEVEFEPLFRDFQVWVPYDRMIGIDSVEVTATATEINVLDGIATGLTAEELSLMDGVTATTAEINIMDGVTASTADINTVAGLALSSANDVAGKVVVLDSSGNLALPGDTTFTGDVDVATLKIDSVEVTSTAAELNILDGVTATTA